MGTFSKNFHFNLRRDDQKNYYECRDYESVDEKLKKKKEKTIRESKG